MKKIFLSIAICFTCFIVNARTYVFVHGQGGSALAWGSIATELRSKGHRVVTLDLPGHGLDKTNIKDITMASYCQRVIDSILKFDEKVILVGHSMGGMVITKVTDMIPERIEALVYLTAMLPQSGQSLMDIFIEDSQSLIKPVFNADTTLVLKATLDLVTLGCDDCPEPIKKLLAPGLPPSPARPLFEKVYFKKEIVNSKPIYFICATEDKMISYTEQKKMIEANGKVKKVFSLKMSHIMPLVQAADVVEILNGL